MTGDSLEPQHKCLGGVVLTLLQVWLSYFFGLCHQTPKGLGSLEAETHPRYGSVLLFKQSAGMAFSECLAGGAGSRKSSSPSMYYTYKEILSNWKMPPCRHIHFAKKLGKLVWGK